MYAAEHVDLVGSSERHRRNRLGVRVAAGRRRACRNSRHTRDFGRDDAHVRGRDHGIAPARNVTADALHRNILVAEFYSRKRLDLHVAKRRALRLGKAAYLRLRKSDVGQRLRGDLRDERGDVFLCETE